jgi:hypothetical protein
VKNHRILGQLVEVRNRPEQYSRVRVERRQFAIAEGIEQRQQGVRGAVYNNYLDRR